MDLVSIEHFFVNVGKFLLVFIFVFISHSAAVFFYYKIFRTKSLEQLYNELHFKKTPEGQISVIKHIHYYFQAYSLEELIFFNLKYKRYKYFPYFNYFIPILSAAFFFSVSMLSNVTYGPNLFLLSVLSFLFLPILLFVVINRMIRIGYNSLEKLLFRFLKITLDNICITVYSYIILISLISIYQFFFYEQNGMFNNIPSNYVNFPLLLLNYIYKFKIESVSNQLSLAGFYFSLAVGGTVVLSIIDRYYEEESSLREKLLAQVNIFKDLYSENNLFLCLDLSSIISFNLKNIKTRRFGHNYIIKFSKENIKTFAKTLSNFHVRLECSDIAYKTGILRLYKAFIFLVIITYAIGIVTIFTPEQFTTYLLWLFIIDSVLFSILIYGIYTNYRN
ncbi:hypothetical protein FXV91_09305 [Methanosarcina sp. DH2]|nr:hypothetical protein [Methanosarcina sp. DH2]